MSSRSFTVLIVFTVITVLGLAVVPQLTFRLYPSQTGKVIYVNFSYYGASASAVEMDVTSPLEGVLSTIEGIKYISSVSGEGWGQIDLEFERNTNAEKVRFLIMSAVREIYHQLPEGVSYPTISSYTSREQNIVQLLVYAISSNLDPPVLKEFASEELIAPLSQVEGVNSIDLYGANSNDWYIEYNDALMNSLGITSSHIQNALHREGFSADVGIDVDGEKVSPVLLQGNGLSARGWEQIEVANIDGRIIKLGQLATVQLRERDPNGFYRINGQTAVNLVITSTKEANQIATANRVSALIGELQKDLPTSITIEKTYDSTEQLRNDLSKSIIRTAFSIIILLLFVLIATRSFRYLLIITISLFVNLALAMLLYYALKLEIHLYSLSGITLSLGLIIDNTLVMVDHIRHRHNLLVFTALLAATLTTIGALTSIFFLEEEQRRNLTDFAWVIIVNLSVSLIVALLLIPSLVQKLKLGSASARIRIKELRFKNRISSWYSTCSYVISKHRKIVIIVGVLLVGLPVFLLPEKIENSKGFLGNLYNRTLGSTYYHVKIKPYSDKILGGTLRLFYSSTWGKSSWGIPQRTRLYVQFSLPQGSTMEMADGIARLYEGYILSNSEVERSITKISGTSGNIEIFFTPEHENGTFPFMLKSKLERLANTQAAADFTIYGVGLGFSNRTQLSWANSQIILSGYSHKQLLSWARSFADSLRLIPRVDKIWIKGGRAWNFSDEYRQFLNFDSELLLAGGTSGLEFADALSRYAPISDRTEWMSVDERVSLVRIRPKGEIISDFELLLNPIVVNNRFFRTNYVSTISKELISEEIYKSNQQYLITLAYNLIGPEKLISKVEDEQVKKINSVLPVGFRAQSMSYGWRSKSNKQYLLILLMVLIIYIISSVLFESLVKPLAVIVLIPLSFVGVFITYWLFDLSFDQGTFAAFILLGGLVVNSAIYIINEQANLLRSHRHLSAANAYKRAVNAKIIPIVLTVISTVLGLLPFVMFGEEPFWFSLAAGTIGGLIFSIPMLLLFLPALPGIMRTRRS